MYFESVGGLVFEADRIGLIPVTYRLAAPTCTTSFPKFFPWSNPMKASGARSRPSTISSRYFVMVGAGRRLELKQKKIYGSDAAFESY